MPSDHEGSANEISREERLIGRYFQPLATAPGAFGLADDAAVLAPPPGCDLVVTTDGVIAGVHFLANDPPGAIARKALRMNLSDLAAKGAQPIGFLLSIALPAGTEESWIADFAAGLRGDIEHYGCPLFGGDTDRTPGPISVSIAAFGAVPHGRMVRRATARTGDIITVTGTIGDAALGVLLHRDPSFARHWQLSETCRDHLHERYLLPQPRDKLVQALRDHASAAMDISDGLVGDLAKLCRASGLAAEIDVAAVPLSDAARAALSADTQLIEPILTGGDDYEILAAIPADQLSAFQAAAAKVGVTVSKIGQLGSGHLGSGQGVRVLRDGKVLSFARPAYTHF
jgi:thiamine-monophosphate kinase